MISIGPKPEDKFVGRVKMTLAEASAECTRLSLRYWPFTFSYEEVPDEVQKEKRNAT